MLPRLLLVTDRSRTRGRELARQVALAVDGGVRFVLVREPDLQSEALAGVIRSLQALLPPGVLITVHEDREAAECTGVGLHLSGSKLEAAPRGGTGPRPFGRSAFDEDDARRAAGSGADYVILGGSPPPGGAPENHDSLVERVRRASLSIRPIPLYAIGGVSVSRIPELLHAGAHGVAVCGELISANHPRRIAQAMTLALQVASQSPRGSVRGC